MLDERGRVHVGCNVENASYGLTVCAERNAVAAAVAAGARRIRAVAVVSDAAPPASPCGACRQVLAELGGAETEVLIAGLTGAAERTTLGARRTLGDAAAARLSRSAAAKPPSPDASDALKGYLTTTTRTSPSRRRTVRPDVVRVVLEQQIDASRRRPRGR